jgi:hypothetical protein
MALVLADRVKDTTTTTSTGTVTLSGTAPTGYQNFSVIGNGNTTYYAIVGQGTSEWEVGIGTYTSSGTTLSRDTVLASSNGGSLVNFSAGTKDVFVTYPAERSVNLSSSALTSGRVPYATTDGLLTNSANLTFDGTKLTVGGLLDSALTSGRVPYATTSGELTDSANLTFNGTKLTVGGLLDSALTSGRVPYVTTSGELIDSVNFTFNGTTLTVNTIGAFTLSGTVAGGGNQINNVVIGTVTPLAGYFTTLSATGALTYGGVTLTAAVTGTGKMVLDTSPTVNNPTVTNYIESVVTIGTVTTSNTLSLTNGTVQTATLTASTACTFTMPTATAGKSFVLLLKQAASTGNGTATFTSVKWGTAGAPTITATAGKMDILTFISDGTNWYGSIAQGYTP